MTPPFTFKLPVSLGSVAVGDRFAVRRGTQPLQFFRVSGEPYPIGDGVVEFPAQAVELSTLDDKNMLVLELGDG